MDPRRALLLTMSLLLATSAHAVRVSGLRCEYRVDPLGIDVAAPRLSWQLDSGRQTAYQIAAAGLWDSGKVASSASLNVPYAGPALASSQRVTWRVRVWDEQGKASDWSALASFTMGLLKPADWQAQWIGGTATRSRAARGYHAAETDRADDAKWVQLDLGQARPIDTIRLYPIHHGNRAGFGFPLRYRVEVADMADFAAPKLVADKTGADVANPGDTPVALAAGGVSARYVRITATRLPKPTANFCFALSQVAVIVAGANVAEGAAVSAKDSVEQWGWGKAALTDGTLTVGGAEPGGQSGSVALRRELTVRPGLRRAVAHVCGLGCYELTVNGAKVGRDLFSPGWTKYDRTCLYDTHDLTALLKPGTNALGLLLGNGMYNVPGGRYTKFTGSFGQPKAIAQVRLEYADGTTQTVVSDGAWQASEGPLTFSCVYGGEDEDARWQPRWSPAAVVKGPGGELRGAAFAAPPIRAHDVLRPVSVKELRAGVKVYDLGQNVALMPRLTVRGPAGSSVRVTPSELLRPDGDLHDVVCGGGAYWSYTLAGGREERWFPRFFYRGARYLRVELTGGAEVTGIEGVVVHSAAEPAGGFECSSELFGRIHTLVRWAQRSNMVSVLTDCPHREKLGWLEQYHLNGPALRYEFDLTTLFAKTMGDMTDSQLASGLVPSIAPEYVQFGGETRNAFGDSPEWGSALVLVPWQQYLFSGDLDLIRRYYDAMARYTAYLGSRAKESIVDYGLGDWYDIGPRGPGESQLTPKALTATAIWYEDITVMAQAARLLDKAADAERYQALAATVAKAFNARFLGQKGYAGGSQTANAMPLVLGLVPDDRRAGVVEALVADVRAKGITAGDVGYRYLLRALADAGRSDVVFALNNQSDKPGYGFQLKRGATALTEAWDAGEGSSQNHFMLGQINEWFYHDLAGIQPDPARPGFQRTVIRPAVVDGVDRVKAWHDTPYGRVSSSWRHDGTATLFEITVPGNTTATLWLPGASAGQEMGPGTHRLRR